MVQKCWAQGLLWDIEEGELWGLTNQLRTWKTVLAEVWNCQKATRYVTTRENSCPMARFHINKMLTTISYGYTLDQALSKVIQTKDISQNMVDINNILLIANETATQWPCSFDMSTMNYRTSAFCSSLLLESSSPWIKFQLYHVWWFILSESHEISAHVFMCDFVSFHSVGPQSSSMLQMVLEVGVLVTYIFFI